MCPKHEGKKARDDSVFPIRKTSGGALHSSGANQAVGQLRFSSAVRSSRPTRAEEGCPLVKMGIFRDI